jgi:hypothetical protein
MDPFGYPYDDLDYAQREAAATALGYVGITEVMYRRALAAAQAAESDPLAAARAVLQAHGFSGPDADSVAAKAAADSQT